jgi:hypothetical protein
MFAITNSTISANTLYGGSGGPGGGGAAYEAASGYGGQSQGGGLYVSGILTIANSTISTNTIRGGDGGTGGYAGYGGQSQGSALYVSGAVTLSNSTIAGNTLRGGDGGSFGFFGGGNGGLGQGGGLWVSAGALAQICFSTIATNQVTGGTHGSHSNGTDGSATGGGLYNQGLLQTRDTLLAQNTVDGPGTNTGPDLSGSLGSLGHNLVANSQGGGGFEATDLLDVDPRLGPLQDNGGPTQTMALLPGSPAIGAGDPADHPRWDQRGRPYRRVIHGRLDIGAFEVQSDGTGTNPDGLTHAFLLTPDQPSTSSGPFRVDATLAQTIGQAKANVEAVIAAALEQPRQPVPIESLPDQRVQPEATVPATTTVIASRAEDALFAAPDDPLLDVWAANGLT